MRHDRFFLGAVELAVVRCARHGHVIDVGEIGFFRSELDRANAQNTAAAPHVDTDGIGRHIILHEFHAHGSRFVLARPERHIRIEQNDFLFL